MALRTGIKAFILHLILTVFVLIVSGGDIYAQTPLLFDELGAGPKAAAMGQAFTAVADDASAAYYNPAGLTHIHSPLHLTIGFQYTKPRVWINMEPVSFIADLREGDFRRKEAASTNVFYLGYTFNFADISYTRDSFIGKRLAGGITLSLPVPHVNQFRNPSWDTEPYVMRYNHRWVFMPMALALSYKVTDWLSLGGGFLPQVDVYMNAVDSWIQFPIEEGDVQQGFRMNVSTRGHTRAIPIWGLLLKPRVAAFREKLSVGFSYRGQGKAFHGTGDQSTSIYWVADPDNIQFLVQDPVAPVIDLLGFNPKQMTGALAFVPFGGLTIAVDLTWKEFSEFRFFWDLPPDPPFKDVWVPRLGLRYTLQPGFETGYLKKISELTLLAGYYFEPSPVPDMNGPMNILDSDQNVASAGFNLKYNVRWAEQVILHAYFQIHLFQKKTIENDEDPIFGPIAIGGEVWTCGAALSVVY